MRIEQDTRTADFSLRILDGYTGQRHEWSYSVIVPSNQVANPAQWLVDVGSARHGRRSAVYLESAAMFTANTLPDNPYAAANGTVGFILDCVQPDLVSGALSDIGKKWSSQPARTTYPKATHN